nr:hypothetical protein [Luteolibacter rhizosphaerae]
MLPDCQKIAKNCTLQELQFFSIYIPFKRQNFNLAELGRLDNAHASVLINEHLLTSHVARRFFEQVSGSLSESIVSEANIIQNLSKCLSLVGGVSLDPVESISRHLDALRERWIALFDEAVSYLQSIAFCGPLPYTGKLISYLEHLLPTISLISELLREGGIPVFLLLDDAHNLSHTQTQVLNGWVASRTTNFVSIKISSQPNYKTYYTVTGDRIETPHDYTETRTAELYTTKFKGRYFSRIVGIIERRLHKAGLETDPGRFFPPDLEQESEIERRAEELRELNREGKGRGARPSDDASRYSRPDFIRDLAGSRKSSSKYSYAGFEQLVHVSSGITRHFLDCASKMYDRVLAQEGENIFSIPPSVQDEVVREEADELRFRFFGREMDDEDGHSLPEVDAQKVCNLIDALGGLFRLILLSDRSERRVYSIAFSDEPSANLRTALKRAVSLGFLHESSIGKKGSRTGGRTKLYVLTRRLAPHWTLDPTGFAGYLFLSARKLEPALTDPDGFLRKFDLDKLGGDGSVEQLELF